MPDRNQPEESSQRTTTRAIPITLLDFKPVRRNTLVGFAKVRIGRALIISDVTVHVSYGRRWAAMPAKPQISRVGMVVRDRDAADVFSDAGGAP
jgi:hypothetical protein